MDQVKEHVAVFVFTWLFFVPIIIFQSLLCARDDAQLDQRGDKKGVPTAIQIVSPLLTLLAWIIIIISIVSIKYKTAFEVFFLFKTFFTFAMKQYNNFFKL
jgi:hypothetical protein